MELEQLIQSWKVAGNNFSQETFNKTLVSEIIRSKSNSAIQKLFRFDFVNLIILIIMIPFSIWLHYIVENTIPFIHGSQILLPGRILYVIIYFLIPMSIIWYSFKLRHLMELDTSKPLTKNQLHIEKYYLMNKYEKIIGVILGVVLFSLGIILYALMHATIFHWVFMGCVIIAICLVGIYVYKMIYDKQIASIRQNIKELEELGNNE